MKGMGNFFVCTMDDNGVDISRPLKQTNDIQPALEEIKKRHSSGESTCVIITQ